MIRVDKQRIFFIFCVLALLAAGVINMLGLEGLKRMSGGSSILDMRFSYTTDEAATLFDNLGQAGRGSYIVFLLLDFIFIIFMALVQVAMMAYLLKKVWPDGKWQNLKYLAYVRGAFDALENILVLAMLFYHPAATPAIAGAANLMTILKWISMAAVMAIALGGGIAATRKAIFNKKEDKTYA